MTFAAFRTGSRVYLRRPPSRSRAARIAWDWLAEDGAIASLHLRDGYWCCERPDGQWDEVEAIAIRRRQVEGRA